MIPGTTAVPPRRLLLILPLKYHPHTPATFCCCCCCCSHINLHNQVHGHRTSSSYSGAEEYPRGKNKNKPKVVHAYITADAIDASARIIKRVKSGASLRCARSVLVHTSHYSRLKNPSISRATQERLPRIYYT